MSRHGRISSSKAGRSVFVKVAAVILALCLIAALALPAFAADSSEAASDSTPYTYTVRIFPGDKGQIGDGTEPYYIMNDVEPGYEFTRDDFDYRYDVTSKTEKYHVTGMRESGKDNNTRGIYSGGHFKVDRDIDLVISYGIKGKDVAYTINYVEAGTEKVLRDPETFYGNIGEKPVVSYLYVDGYVPQYYNLTGTLDADESKNDWTFYYNKRKDTQVSSTNVKEESGSGTTNSGSTVTTTSTTRTTSGSSASRANSSGSSSGTSTNRTNSTGTASSGTNSGGTSASGTNANGTTAGGSGSNGTAASGTNSGGTSASGTNASGSTSGGSSAGNAQGTTGAQTGTGSGTGTGTAASNSPAAPAARNNPSAPTVNEGTGVANAGTTPQNSGPREIVDLDKEETPLNEYENGTDEGSAATEDVGETTVNSETEGEIRARGMSTPAKVILALAIILALGGAGFFLFRRFTLEDDDEDDEDDEEDDDEY